MNKSVLSVLVLVQLALFSFIAGCGGDSSNAAVQSPSAPTLSSSTPAASATGVALTATIQITFSGGMATSSVTTSNLTVVAGSTSVSGSLAWDSTNKIVTFTPSANLSESTTYTVSLGSGITDAAGNALTATSFTFTTGDFTAPTVSSSTPASSATNIALNSGVQITFSEAMATSSVTTSNLTVAAGSTSVSGSLAWDSTNKTVTFIPSANLSESTTYTVSLGSRITDVAGNALTATSFTFTTGDFTAPTLSFCTPSSGATSVTKSTTIACTFSEAMDSSTLTTSNITVTAGSSSVSGTVALSNSNKTITFTPSANLSPNTRNCINFSTSLKDAHGVALATTAQSCFTTKCPASDDFSTNNLSCFTLFRVSDNPSTQETAPGTYYDSISISNGTLVLDRNTSSSGGPLLAKLLASGDFSVEIVYTSGFPANDTERLGLIVNGKGTDNTTDSFSIDYSMQAASENPKRREVQSDGYANTVSTGSTSRVVLSLPTVLYLKITRSGNSYTSAYKTSASGSYTTLRGPETRSISGDSLASTTDTLYVGIYTNTQNSLGTFIPVIDAFNVLSGSISGQE